MHQPLSGRESWEPQIMGASCCAPAGAGAQTEPALDWSSEKRAAAAADATEQGFGFGAFDIAMSEMADLRRRLPFSDLPLETVVEAVLKAKPASAGKGRDAYAAPIAADEMPQIFRKVLLELQLHVEDEASLLWLCRMLDVNGDGVVTLYEIASMLPMVCGGEAVANERYLFKMTDENGDNYLSKKEFSNYLTPFLSWVCAKCDLSKSATLPDLVAKVVFSKIDTNQDGFISPEEWTSWSAQFNLFTEVKEILAPRSRDARGGA